MESNITELLVADSKRLDEKMTAKYGTPFWHEVTMLEAWRETMQTKTLPHNMGETIKPKNPYGINA